MGQFVDCEIHRAFQSGAIRSGNRKVEFQVVTWLQARDRNQKRLAVLGETQVLDRKFFRHFVSSCKPEIDLFLTPSPSSWGE